MAPQDSTVSARMPVRQRLGAAFMVLAIALATALFWAEVIRLVLDV